MFIFRSPERRVSDGGVIHSNLAAFRFSVSPFLYLLFSLSLASVSVALSFRFLCSHPFSPPSFLEEERGVFITIRTLFSGPNFSFVLRADLLDILSVVL